MIKPLAPRMLRGCSWVWLLVVVAGAYPATVVAQDKGKPAGKNAESNGAAKKDKEDGKDVPEPKEAPPKKAAVEVMIDPKAEEALPIEKLKSAGRACRPQEIKDVLAMAAAPGAVDRDAITRFVNGMVSILTDKTAVKAWLEDADDPKEATRLHEQALKIRHATENLLEALHSAKATNNEGFLQVYNDVLIKTLPGLLKNHLLPRTEAIIVLAKTGNPAAADTFLAQLKDPEQTVWVKLWSAQGLTNIAAGGTRADATLGARGAIKAGKALADFLETNGKEVPWPVTWRALEALGAMRQAADPNDLAKAEMASAAMSFLAYPEANIRVRATAAWALGMFRVNPSIPKYNFSLVAYNIGQLAVECGEETNQAIPEIRQDRPKPEPEKAKAKEKGKSKEKEKEKEPEKEAPPPVVDSTENRTLAELYAALLVKELYQAFQGMDGARESGLLKVQPGQLGQAKAYVERVANLESSVAKAAVELVRATGGQTNDRKKVLSDRVAELKQFLAKNPPKDYHLVAGGKEFHPEAAGEAAAQPEKAAEAAGGPSGGR